MKGIPEPQVCKLKESVSPQMFLINNDEIIYFDKINQHEGRFCVLKEDESRVLFEVGEGEGRISSEDNFYLFNFGESTTITEYGASGEKVSSLNLEGVFFDIARDELGNYVCLGNIDSATTIKIINKNNVEINAICPNNILFGSCIYVDREYVYMGGFDSNNVFKIIKLNYIGSRLKEWIVDVDSCDRIISKIERFGEYLVLAVTGREDCIVFLNTQSSNINVVKGEELGIRSFFDFNIKGNEFYVLDGRCVCRWNLIDIIYSSNKKYKSGIKKDHGLLAYQYLMYTGGLIEHLEKGFYLTLPISILGLISIFYMAGETIFPLYKFLVFGFSFFWIIHFTAAVSRNLIYFLDKGRRIDKLLDVYCINTISKVFKMPFYSGFTGFSFLYLILYPEETILFSALIFILTFILFYLIEEKSIDMVKKQNSDVIVELLQDEDEGFKEYLKGAVEQLRRKNCEKYCIDILIDGNLKDNIIQKWAQSRKGIINEIDEAVIQQGKLRAVLDMNKRDIKYSRLSIIMDYICFIKREVGIKEIQIGLKDDKG